MWYSEDRQYRTVIRYDESDWRQGSHGKTSAALVAMDKVGLIEDLWLCNAVPYFSRNMLKGITKVTTVMLQHRVGEFDWEVVSTGYAFCGKCDQFNKKIGREIAFSRAIQQIHGEHRENRHAFVWLFFDRIVAPEIKIRAARKKRLNARKGEQSEV